MHSFSRLLAIFFMVVLLLGACRRGAVVEPPRSDHKPAGQPVASMPAESGKTALAVPQPEPRFSRRPNTQEQGISGGDLMDSLELALQAATEWRAGDEVTVRVEITNHGRANVTDLEIQGSVQFGLQDTISEGRWTLPLENLAAGETASAVLSYVSTRPGVWYVKAAIYHQGELVKATTRTLYIREVQVSAQPPEPEEDDASLGPPLVENPERLQRLHPEFPIWLDVEGRAVVMIGRVCQRQAPLELFACLKNSKEHESVVSINTRAYIVHAGLLALGLEPGRPAQFYPEYIPAQGPEVEVLLAWKDAEGKVHTSPAQQWVRDVQTKQPLKYPWIFTGSQLLKDEDTGRQYYYADTTGELICVSNFPSAVLDLPIRSTDSNEALLFEAFTENIPPLGTPVTVILRPRGPAPADSETPPQATPKEPVSAAATPENYSEKSELSPPQSQGHTPDVPATP